MDEASLLGGASSEADDPLTALHDGLSRTVEVGPGPGFLQDEPPTAPTAATAIGGARRRHGHVHAAAAAAPAADCPAGGQRPNGRFWLMVASFTLSWFTLSWPGFTSPVLAADCDGCPECERPLTAGLLLACRPAARRRGCALPFST